MLVAPYHYKKDLKAEVGKTLRYEETSLFGPEFKQNGHFTVVGPSAHNRRWYAVVVMKDGLIAKVK